MLKVRSQIAFYDIPDEATSEDVLLLVNNQMKKRALGSLFLKNFTINVPTIFSQNVSSVSPSQNLMNISLANQAQRTVFAAPTTAGGTPVFRALELADISDYSQASINYWTKTGSDLYYATGDVNVEKRLMIKEATGIVKSSTSTSYLYAFMDSSRNGYIRSFGGDTITFTPQYRPLFVEGSQIHLNQGDVLINSTTNSGLAKLQVTGAIQQTSVVNALLKADTNGVLVAAVDGTDYLSSSWIANNYWVKSGTSLYYNGGNVGIGTTAPISHLSLVKTIVGGGTMLNVVNLDNSGWSQINLNSIDSNSGGGHLTFHGSTNSLAANVLRLYNRATGSLEFGTANATRMTIISNGNIGIGTTAPNQNKLHIASESDSAFQLRIERKTVNSYQFGISAQTASSAGDLLIEGTGASQGYVFRTHKSDSSFVNALAIDRDGKVGINTLIPTELLHINAPLDGGILLSVSNAIKGIRASNTGKVQLIWWGGSDVVFGRQAATETGYVSNFYWRSGSTATTKMFLSESGLLGLGTDSPQSELHLYSTAPIISSTASNLASGVRINVLGQTSGILFRVQKGGITVFRVEYDGTAMFGTETSNGYKMIVNSGSSSGQGVHVTGSIFATDNVTSYSDKALKTNIKTLKIGSVASKIGTYSYLKNGKKEIGLIAQEVQAYFPEMVGKEGNYLTLNYASVGALAWQLGRENQQEIEALKNRISELENEVEKLKKAA